MTTLPNTDRPSTPPEERWLPGGHSMHWFPQAADEWRERPPWSWLVAGPGNEAPQ